jgi:hypothetical protein
MAVAGSLVASLDWWEPNWNDGKGTPEDVVIPPERAQEDTVNDQLKVFVRHLPKQDEGQGQEAGRCDQVFDEPSTGLHCAFGW